jgi:hypothetical protein
MQDGRRRVVLRLDRKICLTGFGAASRKLACFGVNQRVLFVFHAGDF